MSRPLQILVAVACVCVIGSTIAALCVVYVNDRNDKRAVIKEQRAKLDAYFNQRGSP